MKFFLAILLLAAMAMAQSDSAPPSQSIPVDQENASKARAVLNQTIQALGGPAYLNIQDITQEGRTYSFYHGRPNSLGILFWRFYKFPDKDRIELTKQRDVIYVYEGDKGTKSPSRARARRTPKISLNICGDATSPSTGCSESGCRNQEWRFFTKGRP